MSTPYSFLSCFVQSRDVLRVVAQIDELKNHGSTASQMMKWTPSGGWTHFGLEWHATRVCYTDLIEPTALALGPDGIVSASTRAGPAEEHVDASLEGPARRGPIRDLTLIAGVPYAVGMGRQVYRREGPDNWTHQDQGTLQARGVIELCGFNAVDGLAETSVHAVGFNGEIWHRQQGVWQEIDSPTNLVLHAVKVVREDLVFASGQLGTLLRSNGAHWEVIKHDVSTDDFWGLEWFNDTLYVASENGLFWLDGNDDLQPVDMGISPKPTGRHLHAADGVLLSSGPKNVCWTDDGQVWHEVTP